MAMAHFGSGIWSKTRRTTGPIFSVTVPATMMRSLCRGLGRKTPAPKRSMSKREEPAAIISMAQQASPNVIGHSADLRPQLTSPRTGFAPITGAATFRRSALKIESTVVSTMPSWCSAMLCPFEGALAPGVVVADDEDADEDEHLDEGELGEGEVVAHVDDGPRQQEDGLHVEDEEEHRDDVVAHGETVVRLCDGVDAALVGAHLRLAVLV